MPRLSTTVTVNLHGLRRFKETLEQDLRGSGTGPIRDALHEWAVLMARFLRKRWMQFSHGGGNWRPLKPATLDRKRRRGLLRFILRATDEMYRAFEPELARKPGKVTEDIPFGVRVGFGGGMKYPHSEAKGLTIAELAMIHQQGNSRLPARKIIVPPDLETRGQMREVMQEAMVKVAKGES